MLTTRAPLIAVAAPTKRRTTPQSRGAREPVSRPTPSTHDGQSGASAVVLHWTGRESKALRLAMRLSQRRFGARLGLSLPTVARWELGRSAVSPFGQTALDALLREAADDVVERFEAFLKRDDAAITVLAPQGQRDV